MNSPFLKAQLDRFTIKNLELLYPQQEEGVSLIDVLDQTVTPMGVRLIKKWIVLPLKDIHAIHRRLDTVEVLVKDPTLWQNIFQALKQMGDLERLISKVAVGRVNPRELLALKKALYQIAPIQHQLQSSAPYYYVAARQARHGDFSDILSIFFAIF